MHAGSRFWVIVWFGILILGLLGLATSAYWGRRTRWRNLDEVLRSLGTMLVSAGMLLLLLGRAESIGTGLLGLALGVFVAAFVSGRDAVRPPRPPPAAPGEGPPGSAPGEGEPVDHPAAPVTRVSPGSPGRTG